MGFLSKIREDVSDVCHSVTRTRNAPLTDPDHSLGSTSRKTTGLRRFERARHMTDEQLGAKYQTSVRKLVRHAGGVVGAEGTAVASHAMNNHPMGLENLKTAAKHSVKSGRQVVRSDVYRQELLDRGYTPAFGMASPPQSGKQLKDMVKTYSNEFADGMGRGAGGELMSEFRDATKPEYTSLPMNTPLYTFNDGHGGTIYTTK